jgi:TPR repeat protein
MDALGCIHRERNEPERAVEWLAKGAEAGLPRAMYNLGSNLDMGVGVAAPDYTAAADWYRRAADGGIGRAAGNLCTMYTVGRGEAWQIMPGFSSVAWISLSFLDIDGNT